MVKNTKFYFFFKFLFLEQLKIFQTPFNRICQRDECIRIWKQLARELMLSNEDIQYIDQQYPSKHEKCLRSLEHWALNQSRADISCLAKIIRTLGFKPLARMYLDFILISSF
jgi:hypothetical protein